MNIGTYSQLIRSSDLPNNVSPKRPFLLNKLKSPAMVRVRRNWEREAGQEDFQ